MTDTEQPRRLPAVTSRWINVVTLFIFWLEVVYLELQILPRLVYG